MLIAPIYNFSKCNSILLQTVKTRMLFHILRKSRTDTKRDMSRDCRNSD